MRRWLIIVFVLLLPWRLWAGDAMALEVLHLAPAAAHGPAQMASDDPLHQAAPQALATDDSACPGQASETGAHALCLLCGICHQALAVPLRLGAVPPALHSSEPLTTRTVVLQAEREPELKPPIL